jgi:hypothetical protein
MSLWEAQFWKENALDLILFVVNDLLIIPI